jgi:hypothetical protein
MLVDGNDEMYATGGGLAPGHKGAIYIYGTNDAGFALMTTASGGQTPVEITAQYDDTAGPVLAPAKVLLKDDGGLTSANTNWAATTAYNAGGNVAELDMGAGTVLIRGTGGIMGPAMGDGDIQPMDLGLYVRRTDPAGDWTSAVTFTAI